MRLKTTSPGTFMLGISSLYFYFVTASAACIIARMRCLQLILPFGWFDRPPSVNRLIGIKWRASVLYGEDANYDIPRDTREFYRLSYHIDLSDEQLNQLIEHAVVGDDKTR